ncbi:tripartite tricarboxylate transporter substrate binding protein [Pigmentiphaga soli]|uniref:Tripartite tricarboxylate transporter substrate binding protein n=1 Tax=Pigmentiphaga soli TaxID=1007095 RepID=A0ABP8GH90_9BURK
MKRRSALPLLAALSCWGPAMAQDYPTHALRIIVPFAPGGSNDVVMRLLAPRLAEQLGQPVVIENRPGGGSTIGMDVVAKSPPDGYTLGVANISFGSNPFVMAKMPFDARKDFVPVGLVALVPLVVVVNPSVPARSVSELIDYAKAHPDAINYGSAGNASGPHLATALFNYQTGTKMTHISYKSGGEAVASLLGGVTTVLFATIASSVQQIKSGRIIPLAVTTLQRDPSLPDVPTVSEAGVPGFSVSDWVGIVAPAGTPGAIVTKVNEALARTLAKPEVRASLAKVGTQPVGGTPAELDDFINKELATWSKVVKAAGIHID